MYYKLSTNWSKCSRPRCFVALILVVFLPVVPLVNRPRPSRPADVTTAAVTSSSWSTPPQLPVTPSAAECVVTATSSAPRRRVIGLKRMAAGRLGNDMFVYASLVGIAARNQMVPVYKCNALDQTFEVSATGQYVIVPPTTNVVEESAFR